MDRFEFPRWTSMARQMLGAGGAVGGLYVVALVTFGASPKTIDAGYAPRQPVPFSHAIHAGQLGMDCRYCHQSVDKAAHSSIPSTQTCMNCHARVRTESQALAPVRQAAVTGEPVQWVKVHDLPDYVYFNHSAHVTRGVSCVSCHGRIDQMEVVRQEKPLSMGWCLECHRNPEPHLRPPELVTKLDWKPAGDPVELGKRIRAERAINPSTDCSTCHR